MSISRVEKTCEPPEHEEVKPQAKPQRTTVTVSFAGDCTIGTDLLFPYANSFTQKIEEQGYDYSYFFNNVKPVFEVDDLTVVNLETTLTKASRAAEKKFRFKGEPSYVNILKEGSIEMVNIANNHICDYLEEGFRETVRTLEDAGVLFCGEGYTAWYEVKGIKIAGIGFTGWDNTVRDSLEKALKNVREKADIVIVSFHWGNERRYYPNSIQTELGRFCIDMGADIVVGHHPHVIQGIEFYKARYIVYSLGNFCFGGNRNPADKDSFIFQCTFTLLDKKTIDVEKSIIPCRISSVEHVNDYQPVILEGKEGRRVLERIYKYSSKLKYGIKPQCNP